MDVVAAAAVQGVLRAKGEVCAGARDRLHDRGAHPQLQLHKRHAIDSQKRKLRGTSRSIDTASGFARGGSSAITNARIPLSARRELFIAYAFVVTALLPAQVFTALPKGTLICSLRAPRLPLVAPDFHVVL